MFKSLKNRITELNRELASLKEDRNRSNLEAKKWAERRDSIHGQIKSLGAEAADLREKRDKINDRIQELKNSREQAKTELKKRHVKLLVLTKKLRVLTEREPPKNVQKIKNEIGSLEWEIQTVHHILSEEKFLIDRIKSLEAQLLIHKRILKLKDDIVQLKTEKEAFRSKARTFHEKLSELVEQSQKFHERMRGTLEKIHAFQVEADSAHKKYLCAKQQGRDFRQKHEELAHQTNILKQKLRQAEEEEIANRRLEIHQELEKEALEKLKRGEKLKWEEFKILVERGVL